MSFARQEMIEDEANAPYICGYVESEGLVDFGDTYRGFFDVDMDICGDNAMFSIVGMLSECTCQRGESASTL